MSVRVLHFNDPSPRLPVIDQDLNSPNDREEEDERELSLYRDRTVLLLRRYMRLSLEAGRLPSLLGRECFRTRFSAYLTHTFEDVVIFVHNVERSLEEFGTSQSAVAGDDRAARTQSGRNCASIGVCEEDNRTPLR